MRYITFFCMFFIIIANASATKIFLSVNATELKFGEEIKIHLGVYTSKPIGGALYLYKIEKNNFKLVKTFIAKPSPGQCYSCANAFPISENFERDFYFKPIEIGDYSLIANFGNATEKVNFTVFPFVETKITTTKKTSTTKTTIRTINEKFCEEDYDCICGKRKEEDECFYGNKIYFEETGECSDFCNELAKNFSIICIKNECTKISKEKSEIFSIETTTTLQTKENYCITCSSFALAKLILIFIMSIYIVYILYFTLRRSNMRK
ncbi:MAG: hypothetical protein QW802_01195 [Candidatus Altiarchaeota archaeon]